MSNKRRGRAINETPRTPISNQRGTCVSMDEQISSMVNQIHGQQTDDIDEDIIDSSQPQSMQSLTFSDVMRVAAPRMGGRVSIQGISTLGRMQDNVDLTNRTDFQATGPIPANPSTGPPPTSNKELISKLLADNMTEHLRAFDELLEKRLQFFKAELRKEAREDLKTLHEHIHKQIAEVEKTVKKTIQNDPRNLYPYEKPHGFPLESMNQFTEFEADAEKQQSLKQYLTHVGGVTARAALNQFLKETMADSLTKNFSWTGRTVVGEVELRPLFNTRVGRVFYDALLGCHNIPHLPDRTAFATLMQEAIRAAKQRLRDAARRPQARRLGRRQQYLAEMDQHYETDNDNNNAQPEDIDSSQEDQLEY